MSRFRVDHIHLKSLDPDKTAQWYVDMFDAELTFVGQFRGSVVKYVEFGDLTVSVCGQYETETGDNAPIEPTLQARFGIDHFGFAVEDVARAVADLRGKGVTILEEPWSPRPGLVISYIQAPDDVRIELTQRD